MGIPLPSIRDTPSLALPTPSPTEFTVSVVEHSVIRHSVVVIRYTYPFFILVFFLVALTCWGIHTAAKKPKPAWASTQRATPSSPTFPKGRSLEPNGTNQPGFVRISHIEDDDDHSDTVSQDKLYHRRRPIDRLRVKLTTWFNGDLEGFCEGNHGSAQHSGFESHHTKVSLTPMRRAMFHWAVVFVILSYMANAVNIILHALTKPGWWCGQDVVVCLQQDVLLSRRLTVLLVFRSPIYPCCSSGASPCFPSLIQSNTPQFRMY